MLQQVILPQVMAILGFLTIPWLGPKYTEPRVTSVPKAKLGHSNCVRHRVILPLVMAILGFLTIPWLGPKDTETACDIGPKGEARTVEENESL